MAKQVVQIKTDSDNKTGIITVEIYVDGNIKVGFGVPVLIIPDLQKALTAEAFELMIGAKKKKSEIIQPTIGETLKLSK